MKSIEDVSKRSPAAVFFAAVADVILEQHKSEIPDLRRAIVLLPNHHVAQPLGNQLAGAAQVPTLLLPQMVTLSEWVLSVPLTSPVVPATRRAATLYQALRSRRWFADADLWGIVRELLALLDELTEHRIVLPQSPEEFLSQLEQAYQAGRGSAMQFEARVVHELWYAMNAGGELDTVRATQQRLAALTRTGRPLYVLQTCAHSATEHHFFEAYRQHATVMFFDLREMAAAQPDCAAMQQALSAEDFDLPLQAKQLRQFYPTTLPRQLRLFAAHGLEQEASAAELQVRRWLLSGKQNIAIVAQDRLVARRVRALLERADVLVRDETGWTFSTLSVSTVLMRWLDTLQSNFYYQDLLDLLKSPFIFADQPAHERKQAVYQLEQLVRKHGVVAHLDAFMELSHDTPAVQLALARLRQAATPLQKSSATLQGWLHALQESLDVLGIIQGLAADAAGTQLLQALHTWQQELAGDMTRFSANEWRHWLAQQFDARTFSDIGIDSPVLLTHLAATRWRNFDAVLLLGCDAAHLPGADSGGIWFNDAVRATLGLPTRALHLAQQRDDLLALLALNGTVLATWQASRNGEANLLSPYLEILRALHQLAFGDDLAERELGALLHAQVRAAAFPLPQIAVMPAPAIPPNLVPQRISPSGYNSLVACPYQFYARHLLRLNEMDEVREGVEKRDYGGWVHTILHRFHEQFPAPNPAHRDLLEAALLQISSAVFSPALQRDYLALAWLLRWQRAIPAYVDSQLVFAAQGWRYQQGEVGFELPLNDHLLLHGRVDRVDTHSGAEHGVRVLDYKMMDAGRLRNKLKEAGEDVQLACYAYVYEAADAAFVSIEKDQVVAVAPPQEVAQLAQANIARLLQVHQQMQSGAAMPAHGAESACAYCEMRGLCRKSEWSGA
ncbi:MAG: PD-(D/E)XK nuclease family protein [Pseudomonadota bacterium]